MHPDEVEQPKDALQMEGDILQLFADMKNMKVKKVVKLAKTLLLTKTERTEQRLLNDIAYHRDPVGFVKRCIDLVGDVMFMQPKFVAEGYHGMIIDGVDVYPIHVKAQPHWLVRDWPWTPEQEYEIQLQVLTEYLDTYEKDYALSKVILFADFGFSGSPRIIESRRDTSVAA